MNDWTMGNSKLRAQREAAAIEAYLRAQWGDSLYEQSAFAKLARVETARAAQLRARPKKGK